MATEDAVWLADKVAENPDDLPAAFRAYVQQRYLRTARVQIMARVYGDFYHARGPAAELRNQMLGVAHAGGVLRRHRLALRRDVRRADGFGFAEEHRSVGVIP